MYHRGHPNWILSWLKIPEGSVVNSGDTLFYNEKEIGKITSLACIPERGILRGIAMVRHEFADVKNLLSLSVDSKPIIKQEALPFTIV